MQSYKQIFLQLVRLGIGHSADAQLGNYDWQAIQALAEKQGLSALIIDGIERMPEESRPPKELLLEWIGVVFQEYEYRYECYKRSISELAKFYNSHGYKMMVLKGYTCGLDWPKPEHRPYGDIDIWLFGNQKEADAVLEKENRVKIEKEHHHHTVFLWGDFFVENHYDFVNIHAHKSSANIENVFKELGDNDLYSIKIYGERLFLPSPNLHALFLIRHALSHFAAASINIRQVLDWAFFVDKHSNEIDWEWFNGILKEYHMMDFLNTLNAICVEDLGFESQIFGRGHFKPELKDKVLDDMLEPKFEAKEINSFLSRWIYRLRRWQGNAWKHKVCYEESRWNSFWTELISHIKSPTSVL